MRELIIKAKARLDILEIWHHIAKDNIENANRVNAEIEAEIEDLRRFPGKGHKRAELRDQSLVFWRIYSYLIAYRYDPQRIKIVRVVHGARNLKAIFRTKGI
jgi:toxin ParE1/3/4